MQKAAAQSIAVQQPHALQTAPSTVATTQTEFTVHTQQ
jgi:hypothetical protein